MALVVFLRGLNVGGHRTFRPTTLAAQLKRFGAVNIGATGTFVIRKQVSRAQLRAEITHRLPFEAEIIICNGREIARLMSQEFFAGQPLRHDIVRFVSVLARLPRSAPQLPTRLPSSGTWLVQVLAREGRFLVGVHRRQMRAISCLGKLDRVFGAPVTTRSWNTMAAIAKVLDQGAP